jgi:hypothetical protein
MDSARDIKTNEIIEAEQLWDLEFVDKERYRCIGYGTLVWPASYKRDINKKRPYFTLGVSGTHVKPCDIDGEEEVIKRAKAEKIGTPEGFPLPYPNKLVLTDERPVIDGHGGEPVQGDGGRSRSRGDGSRTPRANHGHTVKTIRPIAKAYMKYPLDRESLPLQVPDCEGNTFATVFWRLGKIMAFRQPTHLYYAPLHWKAPTKADSYMEWQLNAGNWDKENNRRGDAYRMRVEWTGWSVTQRNTLLHEIEVSREKAKHSTGAVEAWLFFIGTQDSDDPTQIIVNRYQTICCIEGPRSI